MGWLFVFFASLSEMVGVLGLNYFSKKPTVLNGLVYYGGLVAALVFLYQSFAYLQVSVAYAVWVGVGTAGAVIMNMMFFNEAKNVLRVVSLLVIITGVVGLKAIT